MQSFTAVLHGKMVTQHANGWVFSRDDISKEKLNSLASCCTKIIAVYSNLLVKRLISLMTLNYMLVKAHLNVSLPVDITEDLLQ